MAMNPMMMKALQQALTRGGRNQHNLRFPGGRRTPTTDVGQFLDQVGQAPTARNAQAAAEDIGLDRNVRSDAWQQENDQYVEPFEASLRDVDNHFPGDPGAYDLAARARAADAPYQGPEIDLILQAVEAIKNGDMDTARLLIMQRPDLQDQAATALSRDPLRPQRPRGIRASTKGFGVEDDSNLPF